MMNKPMPRKEQYLNCGTRRGTLAHLRHLSDLRRLLVQAQRNGNEEIIKALIELLRNHENGI